MNCNKEIAVYDNTVSARTYVSYIAESAGGFACIGRDGKLYIKTIGETTATLPIKYFQKFKWGEKIKITRVSYEDGIKSFKNGDTTGNTIHISQDNMYIVDQEQIDNIYNQINGLEVYSFEGDSIIDPSWDIGDLLIVDNKKVIFQGSADFGGKWKASINSKIQCKAKEETMVKTPSQAKINRRFESEINQTDGKITQLAQETKENTEKISKHEQTLESISDKVSNIEDLTNNVEGVKTIVLANCVEGKLLNLHIYGNNTVFKYLYPSDTLYPSDDLYPYGDSRIVVTDKDNNQTIYELGVLDVLRQNDKVCDEFILENGQAKVIRRVNKSGTTKAKESVEELGKLEILLKEGTNTITIQNYTARIKAKWAIKSNYTDIFATNIKMETNLELQAQKFDVKLSKKVDEEEYTSAEILLKINKDESEAKIKADKISLEGKTINLTSENVKITSRNFSVDENGKLSCTNADISGKLTAGSEIIGATITGGTISIGNNRDFYVNSIGTAYCKSLHVTSKENVCTFDIRADDDTRLIEFTNNHIILRKTVSSSSAITIGIDSSGNGSIYLDSNGGIILGNLISINLNSALNGGNLSVNGTNALISCEGIMQATNFVNTSEERFKINIQKLADKIKNKLTTKTALDIIKNTDICEFNYYGKTEKTVGLVIGEGYKTPKELIKTIKDSKGKESQGIDLYSMISLAYKAIQELADKISNMEVIN